MTWTGTASYRNLIVMNIYIFIKKYGYTHLSFCAFFMARQTSIINHSDQHKKHVFWYCQILGIYKPKSLKVAWVVSPMRIRLDKVPCLDLIKLEPYDGTVRTLHSCSLGWLYRKKTENSSFLLWLRKNKIIILLSFFIKSIFAFIYFLLLIKIILFYYQILLSIVYW